MSLNQSGNFKRGTCRQLSLLLLCGLGAVSPATAAICRVDGIGSGNGSSWAQAIRLQPALTSASCTEVWVKAGIYLPGGLRSDSFKVLPGVKVYGGFAGVETALAQRNPVANLTTLSGDIGVPGDANDNNYQVVLMDGATIAGTITASTVLDGFTVSGGKANGPFPASSGGGLYCNARSANHECSPTIANIIFADNSAGNGGGMYNDAFEDGISSPTLTNVSFINNSATNAGGGLYNNGSNQGNSSPDLSFVSFSGNSAGVEGGAMSNVATGNNSTSSVVRSISSPTLSNVSFSGNTAGNSGGAMLNKATGLNGISMPTLSNVTFSNNQASKGGGVYSITTNATAVPTISRIIFSNVTFSGNTASDGAAMYHLSTGATTSGSELSNVTFSGNSASNRGGAIFNFQNQGGTTRPTLKNVIAWGNSANTAGAEIFNDTGATAVISDSVVQGGCPITGPTTCNNVINANPQLGALANNGGFTQTRLPGAGSAAIDAGHDGVCAAAPVNGVDQRGTTRPQGPRCDIGAVEAAIDLVFRNGFDAP